MKLSRTARTIIGALTVWPVLYCLLSTTFILVLAFGGLFGLDVDPFDADPFDAPAFFFVHILTTVEVFALMIFYIVYLFKTDRVPQDKKALWAVVIFLGHVIAIPVFWYLYIRRPAPPQTDSTQPVEML